LSDVYFLVDMLAWARWRRGGSVPSLGSGEPGVWDGFAISGPAAIVAPPQAGISTGGQMAWTRAAGLAELKERRVMDASIGGEEIALYWVDDAAWATHNMCTHAYARLSDGYLDGDCIECPIHQALFEVKTGAAVTAPASTPVKTYPCRVEGDDVLVDI
jgi:3-phenylpropionate/trans-cinnamate dioxygenase ferredoxin component